MTRDDDLLEQARRALRDTTTPSEQELADGRAVLLWAQRSAARKKTPRGRTLRWVLPLAAVLTAGTALAATTGQLEWVGVAAERCVEAVQTAGVPRAKSRLGAQKPVVAASPATMPSDTSSVSDAGSVAAVTPVAPEPPVPPPVATPTPTASRDAKPVGAWRPKSVAPAKVASAPEPLPPPVLEPETSEPRRSADLAAYREAHRLHFGRRDFATALTAWDAYLAGQPHGTFAVEALYNRAICLLRLGRKDEARRALVPFAQGAMQNHYRQSEAIELLEALE